MWRRQLPSWVHRSGFHSTSELPSSRIIAAEVAQLVSLQSPGMVELPSQVQEAIDHAAAETNQKLVKQKGQELTQRLRHMSRSKHRGGVHPNLREQSVEEAELAAFKPSKRQTRRQLLHGISRAPALPVEAGSEAAPDLSGYWDEQQKEATAQLSGASRGRIARRQAEGLYDEAAALAYGAARLPACYAALRRVLGEVAARRPGWRPGSVLDFGAGPATATWAAQEVWGEGAPLHVTAVEPSPAMTRLGQRVWSSYQGAYQLYNARAVQQSQVQQGEKEEEERGGQGGAKETGAEVQWQATWAGRELSPVRLKQGRSGAQLPSTAAAEAAGQPGRGGEAEAAGAAEEAGEAEDGEEDGEGAEEGRAPAPPPRMRWMSRLPRGTPGRQYDLVLAAYVLGELTGEDERRRAVQDLWQRTAGLLVLVEPGTPAGFAHINAARSQLLAARGSGGGGGSGGQGAGGAQGAGQLGPEAHVVAPCPHDGACPLLGRRSWCHFVQRFERTELQRKGKSVGGRSVRVYQDERFSYVVLARGPRLPMAEQAAVAGSLVRRSDDPLAYLHLPDNLQPRTIGGLPLPAPGPGATGEGGEEGGEGEASSGDEEELEEATRQLILESILADMDDEEGEEGAAELAAQLRQQLFQQDTQLSSGPGPQDTSVPPAPALSDPAVAEANEGEADSSHHNLQQQQQQPQPTPLTSEQESAIVAGDLFGNEEGEEFDWAERDPEGHAAAVASSGVWSRVLRTPRKRSAHVVLDLCSAVQADGAPAPEGVLLRQVVGKGSAQRQLGGLAPYRLARKLRWGDLWPLYYQRQLKAAEPPAAEAFQQE